MPSEALRFLLLLLLLSLLTPPSHGRSNPRRSIPRRYRIPSTNDSPVYLWPLPTQFSHGDGILYVDPDLFLDLQVPGDYLEIVSDAFERYKDLIFTHWERSTRRSSAEYDVAKITVIVSSTNDTLQFGVDESYILYVGRGDGLSVVKGATIEANTIYGALRGLETFSQLCIPNYTNKSVEIQKAPWSIKDEPRFNFRGLLIDTSRHYLPVNVIKQVIDAMSYAKLNVLHWHILDEESFPLEVPSYPNLWKGSYSKLERYTIEDAYEVVDFAKKRGIHIMAEVDVPGHAESWGSGYPDLWPSANCTEPLDVSKNFTFEVISGILSGHENGAKLEHKAFGTWSWSKEHALAVSHDMGVFHDTDVFLRPKLNEEQSENKTNNAQHGLVVPPRHSCAPSGSQRAVSSSTRSGHGGMAMPQP